MKGSTKEELIAAAVGVLIVAGTLFAFFALGADSLAQKLRNKLGIKVGT